MPRIVSALAIAAAIIIGVFIIKNKTPAPKNSPTELIAEQIQNANQSSIDAYGAELESEGVASDTSVVIPPPTLDVPVSTSVPSGPPTATDKLAQNILETYVNAKQSGVDISDDVATQMADNLLSQPYMDSSSAKTYSAENIEIETSYSSSDIKNYGNAVGAALSTPLPAGAEDELSIFSDFAATNDETILPKLDQNIARYQKIISKMLLIPVPQVFAESDLDFINTMSQVVYEIQKVRNLPSDPVGGANAMQQYQTTLDSIVTIQGQEKAIFTANNIVFFPTEAGYSLTQ